MVMVSLWLEFSTIVTLNDFKSVLFRFILFFKIYLFIGLFLGPHLRHMEVPRPEVQSELQLLAYTTTAATQEPHQVWDLHLISQQHQIFNPLSEVRDRTVVLMYASRAH